ncbi:MAG: NosD domain-containing protein, partial [Candidatus Bathyarchaeia archaeon]
TFKENQVGVVVSSSYNVFYRNNFLNNTNLQVQFLGGVSNKWDNGVEGNFWSDYEGEDTNGDGIGDTNIPIWGDSKPLIEPWSQVRMYMVNSYCVVVECNFTVASFQFNSSLNGLNFRITGPSAWSGFFNITIPKTVLDAAPNEWRIFLVSSQYFLNVTQHTKITSNNTHVMMHYSGNVAGYTVYIIASKSLPSQEKIITCIELLINKREVKAGELLVLYAKLTDVSGQPLAGKVIVFSLLGESWNKTEVTNSSGFAMTQVQFLLVGILKFRATFQGDQDLYGSFDETSVTFKPLSTTLVTPSSINATQHESLTLIASLKDENNVPVKRATIKFYIKSNGFRESIGSNKTGENGVATLIYEPTKTGVFQLIAVFDGEGIYAASSATSTLVVSPKPWRLNYVYIIFPAILLATLIIYLKLRKMKNKL